METNKGITAGQLLSLKEGARLRVKRTIRKVETELLVVLLDSPRMEPIGKPGLHRVRMRACGALGPRPMAAGALGPFSSRRGAFTVDGTMVLEIVG